MNKDGYLDDQTFKIVVENAPLVSIDLVIVNTSDEFLFGKRSNRPAKDSLFFPGGRIQKGEKIKTAIERIMYDELGSKSVDNPVFIGYSEHHYRDGIFHDNDEFIETHYISLGFLIKNHDCRTIQNSSTQHSEILWMKKPDALLHTEVHEYCKDYLNTVI